MPVNNIETMADILNAVNGLPPLVGSAALPPAIVGLLAQVARLVAAVQAMQQAVQAMLQG